MYLLVGWSLCALLAGTAGLAMVSMLSFNPVALLISTAIFTMAGVTTSYGLGKLYGVHSHLQSALITSLILALVFTPSLDGSTLLHYGLIAVIAQASKFVITYRSRHIFNPAAFGAVFGGSILQLQYASWWVGTPVLVVPVAIVALLVLYKIRQLQLGAIFLVTSLAVLLCTGIQPGVALISWPLIFLASIMLSEPATLPPRRRQKFLVAIVVALFVSLPFHIGWFYSSPEFALLMGNIVAFALAFRQRKGLRLTLRSHQKLTPTTDELVFTSPVPIVFEAGQYIELTLPHPKQDIRGIRRSFSITSRPNTKELRLGVKFYSPGSSFKTQLRALPVGSTVQSTGISGDFVLPKNPREKLLFVAGGIGITPFISHLQSLDTERDIVLLYFVRSPAEIAYRDILESHSVTVHYFTADTTPEDYPSAPSLTKDILAEYVQDLPNRVAYISGPPNMVSSAKRLLRGKAKSVKTDYFSGY